MLELQKQLTDPAPGGDPMGMLRSFIEDGLPLGPVIDGELIPHRTDRRDRARASAPTSRSCSAPPTTSSR